MGARNTQGMLIYNLLKANRTLTVEQLNVLMQLKPF